MAKHSVQSNFRAVVARGLVVAAAAGIAAVACGGDGTTIAPGTRSDASVGNGGSTGGAVGSAGGRTSSNAGGGTQVSAGGNTGKAGSTSAGGSPSGSGGNPAGGGGGTGGGGGAGGGGGGACVGYQQACATPGDCCSGVCSGGKCSCKARTPAVALGRTAAALFATSASAAPGGRHLRRGWGLLPGLVLGWRLRLQAGGSGLYQRHPVLWRSALPRRPCGCRVNGVACNLPTGWCSLPAG